jgi:transcriptional regulator with XRE-family HTH domain
MRIVRQNTGHGGQRGAAKGTEEGGVLSLRELEEKSGASNNTIWRLEDGRQGAHPRTVRKLADALGVDPRELIQEKG